MASTTLPNENSREENQNWTRSNLFEVRDRDRLIEYLKQRERESRVRVHEETIRKRQEDIERRLQDFDRDINLKRILRSDRRYLSIGRDRTRPKFFDAATMARISRDVAKIRVQRSSNKHSLLFDAPPAIDPSLFQDGKLTSCSKFWNEERRRGRSASIDSAHKTTKLPELVAVKKSDNSDCVSHYLELQQYIPKPASRLSKNKEEYSVLNTKISIIRPKYQWKIFIFLK